jgi:hypothetical protein
MSNFADLSHHQPAFDVPTYSLHRSVVALKATEATGFTDPTFKSRWQAAGARGLYRVAYHFARARFDGADEFAHCWAVVRAAGFDPSRDAIALDVEDSNFPSGALANAQEFVSAAVKAGITRGLIYTYPSYAVDHRITSGAFPVGWRRLWYANYQHAGDMAITLPPGWGKSQYYARQYTDKALVAGVGMCDDNRIIQDWLAGPNPQPPTQEDSSMAGWSDGDSANLAEVADWVQRTYNAGFAARDATGADDPTHENVSIRGVNVALDAVVAALTETNAHLAAVHQLLMDQANPS